MNTLFLQRRLFGAALAPILVFFVARILFIAAISQPVHMPTFRMAKQHEVFLEVKSLKLAVRKLQMVEVPKAVVPVVQATGPLSLQSSLREYHYSLHGDVSCGSMPCAAELHLSIDTDHTPDFKQIITTDAQGHFEYQTIVKENARTPIDWRVMVYTPHTYPTELHGRQILTDDTVLDIPRTIQLP